MNWFNWFDEGPEVASKKEDEPWKLGEMNPSMQEPLEHINEGSKESTSLSEAQEKRRGTIQDIQSHMSEELQQQERQEDMVRSQSWSKDAREAYRVADEALCDSTSQEESLDTGVVYEVANKEKLTGERASLVDNEDEDEEEEEDEEGCGDDIDLEVVEQYDHAFNEFIAAHPEFVVISPDVVHSLRVCKLQKLLERGSTIEAELQEQLNMIERRKGRVETVYHRELKEASRKKAARQVHLASKLASIQKATTAMEAKLLWSLVSTFEASAKEHFRKREDLKSISTKSDRRSLSEALPKRSEFQIIRDAMMVPPSSEPLREEQKMDLQQFQIDNAFLRSEVAVLEKKLKHVKAAAKKHAWVETMLVRMDPKVLNTIKENYAASKGVSL